MDSQPEALFRRVDDSAAEITSGRTGWNRPLREQLRWIRVNQKPYLTQRQLALLARADLNSISEFELGKKKDIGLLTLRRWVRAMGCELYVKIAMKSYRGRGAHRVEGPELPPPPELFRKKTGVGRWQAAEYRRLMGKIYRPPSRQKSSKATSGKPDSPKTPAIDPTNPFDFDDSRPPTPHGMPDSTA